jgi:hypothetical protein
MGVTFITPVDVSPGTALSWQDVDVSSYIPSGSTGVLLHLVNIRGDTNYVCGLRKNGSTDARTPTLRRNSHSWGCIGVDSNRIFEAYIGYAGRVQVWLVGYFDSSAVFFDNAVDKSLGSTGAWTDVDISGDTGADTAIGAIFELRISSGSDTWGFRKNGSTDDRNVATGANNLFAYTMVGVDGSEVCEHTISSTNVDAFLVGYIKSGATFNTNATDLSLGGTGAYTDLSALPAGAIGGVFEIVSSYSGATYALRKNGSSEDIYRVHGHTLATVECDGSQLIEGEISNTGLDFFLTGYFTSTATVYTETLADSATGVSTVADLQTWVDTLAVQATTVSTVTDLQQWIDTLATSITSVATVADLQAYVEVLADTITSQASVADGMVMKEVLSDTAGSAASVTDVQTVVETVTAVAGSATSVSDMQTFVETLASTIVAVSAVTDAQTWLEDLTSLAQSSATVADLQTYVESIRATAGSIASVVDAMKYFDDLHIIITSTASIAEVMHYIEIVSTAGVSSATVVEFMGAYIHRTETDPWSAASGVLPFMAASGAEKISFATQMRSL